MTPAWVDCPCWGHLHPYIQIDDNSIVSIFVDYFDVFCLSSLQMCLYFFPYICIILQGVPYSAFGWHICHPYNCAMSWLLGQCSLGYEYMDPQAAHLVFPKSWVLSSRHLGERALPLFYGRI